MIRQLVISLRLLSVSVLLISLAQSAFAQDKTALILQVVNIQQKTGTLVVRLYDTKADFEAKNDRFTLEKKITLVSENSAPIFVKIQELTIGKYAALIFVDNNNNGKIDTDRLGQATEAFTFSRRVGYNLKKWKLHQSFEDVYFEYLGTEIRMMVKVEVNKDE